MSDFEALINQPTLKQVLKEESAEIPDMSIIINSWSTSVNFNFAGYERNEDLFFAGQGIKKADAWLV